MKSGSPMRSFTIIFSLIGIVSIGFGFFISYKTIEFYKNGGRAMGEVIALLPGSDGGYAPEFQFTTSSGEMITKQSSTYTSPACCSIGESIEIIYSLDNPSDAKVNSFMQIWFLPIFSVLFGGVFAAIPFILQLAKIRTDKKIAWLKANGQQLQVTLKEIRKNKNIAINKRHPFQLIADWQSPIDGKSYELKSRNLWENPAQYVEVGQTVTAWVDINNPKKNTIDTSFLG